MNIQNTPFSSIAIGDERHFKTVIDEAAVRQFAALSADFNPTHLDPEFAREQGLEGAVVHRMHLAMILSGYFGKTFPGPGTGWKKQALDFFDPGYVGETFDFRLQVTEKEEPNLITVTVVITDSKNRRIACGAEELIAPTVPVTVSLDDMPWFYAADRTLLLDRLIERARRAEPPTMAVAWPCNKESLQGAVEAHEAGLVVPVLFGPEKKIRNIASAAGIELGNVRIVDIDEEDDACVQAARAVGNNEMEILAKGSPHTNHFLKAILLKENKLRTGRTLSHVFYIEGIPPRNGERTARSLVITDGALNMAPTLMQKADIAQNAINFLLDMGIKEPKVAAIAAVELVNPDMPATIDAAALKAMSERGQITGGLVDGPLAYDVAVSPDAVKAKGIVSKVAGYADVILCPTIEVANVAAKEWEGTGALMAGVLCGAKKPVVLTSRSDCATNRLASVAVAVLLLSKGE